MPLPGMRVRVPFGRRETIGVILGVSADSDVPLAKLKTLGRVLDAEPLLPSALMELLTWASAYYHHPIGDVMTTALPVLLRRGAAPASVGETYYALSDVARDLAPDVFKRSPVQQRVVQALRETPEGLNATALAQVAGNWRDAVKRLDARGFIHVTVRQSPLLKPTDPSTWLRTGRHSSPQLSTAQEEAGKAIRDAAGRFQCLLLHGITGSGKTEVYLRAIEDVIARGGQVLVLTLPVMPCSNRH